MSTMGETLTEKEGPLPMWTWLALFVVLIAGYLIWRKKNQINQATSSPTSSSTGGVSPISNLSQAFVPMPNVAGDTFINGPLATANNTPSPSSPLSPPGTPSGSLSPAATPSVPTPTSNVPQTSSNPYPGWTYLPTYSAFQQAMSQKKTIDWSVNGGPLQPYFSGGKQVGSAPPSGSRWYTS